MHGWTPGSLADRPHGQPGQARTATLAVLGATGPTGRLALASALAAGHRVVAVSRGAGALDPDPGGALLARPADVLDATALDAALEGVDAVVCCLGTKPGERRPVLTQGTVNLVNAMRRRGIRRVVALGSLPLGGDWQDAGAGARLLYRALAAVAGTIVADKRGQEVVLRECSLDWLLVRPVFLGNGAPRGAWHVGPGRKAGPLDSVPRADVATFLVAQATAPGLTGMAVPFLPPAMNPVPSSPRRGLPERRVEG